MTVPKRLLRHSRCEIGSVFDFEQCAEPGAGKVIHYALFLLGKCF